MGNGMNKILPGLYVGNFRDSRDEEQLKNNKITHILSIHDNAKATRSDIIYLCLDAKDAPSQDLTQYFAQCNDFIHSARIYGGNVLVHCLAGVSRSVTLTIAYIMSVTNLGWRDGLNVVRASRTCAGPNFGFQKQLVAFQHEGVSAERERLSNITKTEASNLDDVKFCQEQLDEFACKEILDKYKKGKGEKPDLYLTGDDRAPKETDSAKYLIEHIDELFPVPAGQERSTLVINLKRKTLNDGDESSPDLARDKGGETSKVNK